jgi:hypothetical protein
MQKHIRQWIAVLVVFAISGAGLWFCQPGTAMPAVVGQTDFLASEPTNPTAMPTRTPTAEPTATAAPSPTSIPSPTAVPVDPRAETIASLRHSINCFATYNTDMTDCARYAAELGADNVVLTVIFFQASRANYGMEVDAELTLDAANTRAFIEEAHALGLTVFYKPLMELRDASGGAWRGSIVVGENGPAKWFRNYRAVLSELIPPAADADGIVVGTEFNSLHPYATEWRKTVGHVSGMAPEALLAYESNWDVMLKAPLTWWDAVDVMAVSAYFPLCVDAESPTVAQLTACWDAAWKADLLRLAKTNGKPLWFAEFGIAARTGRHARPWDGLGGTPCDRCQDRWYAAGIAAWDNVDGFAGMTFWSWIPGEDAQGFSFVGRPAEATVRAFFGKK